MKLLITSILVLATFFYFFKKSQNAPISRENQKALEEAKESKSNVDDKVIAAQEAESNKVNFKKKLSDKLEAMTSIESSEEELLNMAFTLSEDKKKYDLNDVELLIDFLKGHEGIHENIRSTIILVLASIAQEAGDEKIRKTIEYFIATGLQESQDDDLLDYIKASYFSSSLNHKKRELILDESSSTLVKELALESLAKSAVIDKKILEETVYMEDDALVRERYLFRLSSGSSQNLTLIYPELENYFFEETHDAVKQKIIDILSIEKEPYRSPRLTRVYLKTEDPFLKQRISEFVDASKI